MKKQPFITIAGRRIGLDYAPLVIAEIGINHNGEMEKAKRMIHDAKTAGAEIVKFQCHVVEDEMVPAAQKTIPANSTFSIYEIMQRCAFSETQNRELKKLTESLGMIYLCTPFSRAAADQLHEMNVAAYKIGSGECNNYPLVEHVARFGKPMIVSTGMNSIETIRPTVRILEKNKVPYVLMHCTNIYPTSYNRVFLHAIPKMQKAFPRAIIGLSNHSPANWAMYGGVALGASVLERHFTSDKSWPGEDIPVSMDPEELKELIEGSRAVWEARGDYKGPLKEEQPTIDFAFACVVTIKPIKKGEKLTMKNIWVKRPGTGEIFAGEFKKLLGKHAARDIPKDAQVKKKDIVR